MTIPQVNGSPPELKALTQAIPHFINGSTSTRPLAEVCADSHKKVENFLNSNLEDKLLRATQEQARKSLEIIREALRRYSLPSLSFSYNGGKDCLVLLILYLAALHEHFGPKDDGAGGVAASQLPLALEAVYIVSPHPFVEVDRFVAESACEYHLSLTRLPRLSMREAFQEYLDGKKMKSPVGEKVGEKKPGNTQKGSKEEEEEIKAIFVGTRRTDPHGAELSAFDPTDGGWPAFMRIHPVLEWHYTEIWAFIRHLRIPYCPLYDAGYTSLGGTQDTHPNPALEVREGTNGTGFFRPAYELVEDEAERLGRDR